MQASVSGLLRLKPFDESDDAVRAGKVYGRSPFMAAGVVASFALAVLALVLTIIRNEFAVPTMGVAVAVSAIVAGLEWNAGLRARSLNQLFAVALIVALIAVVNGLR